MRVPHSGQNTPATSLPLSAIRVNCFVRPVTVRPSFFTGMDMPKALPDWRWHSLQCRGARRIGSVVNTYGLSRIGIRQCRVRGCCSLLSNGDDDFPELA